MTILIKVFKRGIIFFTSLKVGITIDIIILNYATQLLYSNQNPYVREETLNE